jgi:hypothetical protein
MLELLKPVPSKEAPKITAMKTTKVKKKKKKTKEKRGNGVIEQNTNNHSGA